MQRLQIVLTLLTGFAGGCDSQPGLPGTANLGKDRVVVAERWDTIFQMGTPDVNDTVFAAPDQMIMWGSRVAIGDRISMRILAISGDGDLLWTFGRQGHGPGEFVYITSLEVAANGNLLVLDNRNARITEISPEGKLVRVILQRQLPFTPFRML